jgi:hypothetical protein
MSQTLDLRILLTQHKDELLACAKQYLARKVSDPMESEMQSWSARWRGEALDHYLSLGWSFGAFKDDKPYAFLLAQPYLFHRGLTQTLWVEHILFDDIETARALLDTAYRWARDKHFQCVLLETPPGLEAMLHDWQKSHRVETPLVELRTAKF